MARTDQLNGLTTGALRAERVPRSRPAMVRLAVSTALAIVLHTCLLWEGAKTAEITPASNTNPPRFIRLTLAEAAAPTQSETTPVGAQHTSAEIPADPQQTGLSTDEPEVGADRNPIFEQGILSPPSAYVDERVLTARPRVLGAPQFTFPSDAPEGVFSATLKIYIDELGNVQRVAIPGDELARPLTDMVIAAFMALKFAPGEVNGQPVKTTLSIEINFHNGGEVAESDNLLTVTN